MQGRLDSRDSKIKINQTELGYDYEFDRSRKDEPEPELSPEKSSITKSPNQNFTRSLVYERGKGYVKQKKVEVEEPQPEPDISD